MCKMLTPRLRGKSSTITKLKRINNIQIDCFVSFPHDFWQLVLSFKGSVKDKSLFQYDDGLTFRDFYHPEFVPMFLDEVDESRLNDAKAKCGLNPSASCISDYLATGDIEVALSSGKSEEKSDKNIAELGSLIVN